MNLNQQWQPNTEVQAFRAYKVVTVNSTSEIRSAIAAQFCKLHKSGRVMSAALCIQHLIKLPTQHVPDSARVCHGFARNYPALKR